MRRHHAVGEDTVLLSVAPVGGRDGCVLMDMRRHEPPCLGIGSVPTGADTLLLSRFLAPTMGVFPNRSSTCGYDPQILYTPPL